MRTHVPAGSTCFVPAGTAIASQSRFNATVWLVMIIVCRSASSYRRSASCLLRRNLLLLAFQRRLQGVPGERRALDADGKLRHARKHRQLAQLLGVAMCVSSHQLVESV